MVEISAYHRGPIRYQKLLFLRENFCSYFILKHAEINVMLVVVHIVTASGAKKESAGLVECFESFFDSVLPN